MTAVNTIMLDAIDAVRNLTLIREQYRAARPGKDREAIIADHLARPWIAEYQTDLVREGLDA